uniref:LAGLIDADG homing endonuclease n=1 Tax=Knipowitschia caucasica TaxID=637954 RepID=A0AAV2LUM3_KNICA
MWFIQRQVRGMRNCLDCCSVQDRPGRYTVLSQKGIEENSFQGITLNEGKSSDKTLDAKPFFQAVAKNLENRMLSQGGRVPDKTGYNKFIEELKVLYAQYWPEDAVPYVRSWVTKGHRTATDTCSKTRNREKENNPDLLVLWSILDN